MKKLILAIAALVLSTASSAQSFSVACTGLTNVGTVVKTVVSAQLTDGQASEWFLQLNDNKRMRIPGAFVVKDNGREVKGSSNWNDGVVAALAMSLDVRLRGGAFTIAKVGANKQIEDLQSIQLSNCR
jgi:DNA/RNA-binding domain of Phe-tRNA-synthetase-like protein